MSYYKYAERDASTQINWAEIGKNLTDTFQEEARVREEKKATIDANTREYGNTLNTAPQGEFQDGNAFINNYVAEQQQTRLMDDKLLKSGQMDLKTYTMRRQNGVDGTKQLFDLQKRFQDVYSERMKGILDGSLQAQTAFELSQVQGFGDFSKSQALINPVDGRVNVGMTEMVDGVRKVIPNSNIPVNVLMGKIQAALPTFDVNSRTKALVDSQGDLVLSLYQAGSLSGAGTITELTGLGAIEKFAEKSWTESAKLLNSAISQEVTSMLQNKRNLTSILTGQVGGYSAESFTYDKDVAAKDPKKILLKPSVDGGPGVVDESAPNYQKQYKQAADWITTSIKSQMDAKVGVKETSQLSRNDEPEWKAQQIADDKTKASAAGAWNQLYTGRTAAEKQAAAEILLGTPIAKSEGLLDIDLTTNGEIKLTYDNTKKNRTIKYLDNNNRPISFRDFSGLGVELHGVVDRDKAMAAGGGSSRTFGNVSDLSNVKAGRQGTLPTENVRQTFVSLVDSSPIKGGSESDVVPALQETYGNFGFTFEESEPGFDSVDITSPTGKKSGNIRVNTDEGVRKVKAFIKGNIDDKTLTNAKLSGFLGQSTTATGGDIRK